MDEEAADADGASGQGGSAAGGDKEAPPPWRTSVADKRARQADAPAARADAADADGSEEASGKGARVSKSC